MDEFLSTSYHEYLPHPALSPYIEAYWTIKTGDIALLKLHRILPDGCTDIIFNKGNTICGPNQRQLLLSGESYLVGTMTTFSETIISSDSSLLGIRFRPGGIAAFYCLNLKEVTDLAVPYRDNALRELVYQSLDLQTDLDLYFLKRVPLQPLAIAAVIIEIINNKGRIKVAELIKNHAMSERTLERLFTKDVGISVKGMIRLARFNHTVKLIRHNAASQSLSHIAYSAGYFDQAHLCNDIKGYTGLTPTQL